MQKVKSSVTQKVAKVGFYDQFCYVSIEISGEIITLFQISIFVQKFNFNNFEFSPKNSPKLTFFLYFVSQNRDFLARNFLILAQKYKYAKKVKFCQN